ncbi:tubulin-dependent ATPase kip3 [Dimargaris xerosporica]|nr:tubulin-dependent ATPase kip3 [Dimargaris xerosporica]
MSADTALSAPTNDPVSKTATEIAAPTAQESAILVTVRVRPFTEREKALLPSTTPARFNFGCESNAEAITPLNGKTSIRKVVEVMDERILVFDPPDERATSTYGHSTAPAQTNKRHKDVRFAFDRVFNAESTQQEVYLATTQPLIDAVLHGFNATVFAYGATGCGKTHTISGTPEDPGIIFLTMKELFEKIKAYEQDKVVEASLSYLEVYNETIRDLLIEPGSTTKPLALREDTRRGVVVAGLRECHPSTVEDVMELVLRGNRNRTQSPTEANATSSRSHAVLQINIRQKSRAGGLSNDMVSATLSLIDLAGSERASVTKNRGSRLLEGANINRSLLALANCINALCDEKKKRHIPYRDSKLTRLLKFSLGGNCRTVMIVCCSPASTYYEETYNTLKYANRAKNIKTKVERNTLSVKAHVSQYVKQIKEQALQIQRLRAENAALKARTATNKNSDQDALFSSPILPSNALPGEGEPRQTTASLQMVEDIRNQLSTAYDAVRTSEWEYASVCVVADLFAHYETTLKQWHSRYSPPNDDDCELSLEGRQLQDTVADLLSDIQERSQHLTRHLDHTSTLLSRHRLATRQANYTANPLAMKALTSDQKYRLDQERRIFELRCTNTRLSRSLEISQRLLFDEFRLTEKLMKSNAHHLTNMAGVVENYVQHIGRDNIAVEASENELARAMEFIDGEIKAFSNCIRAASAAGPAKWQVDPLPSVKYSARLTAETLVPHPPTVRTASQPTPRRPSVANENRRTARQFLASQSSVGNAAPSRSRSSTTGAPSRSNGLARAAGRGIATNGTARRTAQRSARPIPPASRNLPSAGSSTRDSYPPNPHKRTRGMLSSQPSLECMKPSKRVASADTMHPSGSTLGLQGVGGLSTSATASARLPWSVSPLNPGSQAALESASATSSPSSSMVIDLTHNLQDPSASFNLPVAAGASQLSGDSPRFEPPPLDAVPVRSILKSNRSVPNYCKPTASSRSHSNHARRMTVSQVSAPLGNGSSTANTMGNGPARPLGARQARASQNAAAPPRHRVSARRLLEAAKVGAPTDDLEASESSQEKAPPTTTGSGSTSALGFKTV